MPQNGRNFWVKADIDGRSTIAFGPRGKDGGFEMTIYQRENGTVTTAFTIQAFANNGKLRLVVRDAEGNELVNESER